MKKMNQKKQTKLIFTLIAGGLITSLVSVSAVACSSNSNTINASKSQDLKNKIAVVPEQQSYEFSNTSNDIIGVKADNLSSNQSINYQWYFSEFNSNNPQDAFAIKNTNNSNLQLPNNIKQNPNTYYFFVTWKTANQSGVSEPIKVQIININKTASISVNDNNTYLNKKITINLNNVDKLGWKPVSYEWQTYVDNNWNSINFTSSNSINFSIVPNQIGIFQYRLILKNADGSKSFITNMISINVLKWAQISINSNVEMEHNIITAKLNQSITLDASLANSAFDSPFYQWQTNNSSNEWVDIPQANGNSYSFVASLAGYPRKYRLIVMNEQNSSQNVFSKPIFVNVPSNFGSISLAYGNSLTSNNVANISLNQKIDLAPVIKNDNLDPNKLVYQWQQQTSQGWQDIQGATSQNYSFSISEYAQKTLRVKISLLNNWIAGAGYSNPLTLQVPITASQKEKISTELNNWLANESNQINLLENWLNNAGVYYFVNQMTQWMQTYQVSGLSVSNLKTNLSPFTVQIAKDGLVTVQAQALTNNLHLSVYGSKNTIPILKGTVITVIFPYSFKEISNQGQKLSWFDYKINASGQVSLFFNNNLGANGAFTYWILQDLNQPYGMQFTLNNKSIIPASFFLNLKNNGWKDDTQTVPFNLLTSTSSSNNAIILNVQNSILPNFENSKLPTIIWNASTNKAIDIAKGGSSALISINPELSNGDVLNYTYQWYVETNGKTQNWTKLEQDANTNSLSISVPSDLTKNESEIYRCEVTYFYSGKTISVYSPEFTINFSMGTSVNTYTLPSANLLNYYLQLRKN